MKRSLKNNWIVNFTLLTILLVFGKKCMDYPSTGDLGLYLFMVIPAYSGFGGEDDLKARGPLKDPGERGGS